MHRDLRHLLDRTKQNISKKGQVLVSPDQRPRGVFYIIKGYVKSYDISANGERQLFNIYGPRSAFPLKWAINEERPQLFYESMSDVKLIVLSKRAFQEEVKDSLYLLKETLRSALSVSLMYEQRIQNYQQKSILEKLAFLLLFLQKQFGRIEGKLIHIEAPLTYQDLADSLGTTRETVNRAMRQFIDLGIITREHNKLTINSYKGLRGFIGDEITLGA